MHSLPDPHPKENAMTQISPTTAPPSTPEAAPTVVRALERRRPSAFRRAADWFRGGGASTFVFLLPLLFSFIFFSWKPIVDSAIMAFQKTNLLSAPEFVWFDNFSRVLQDPLLGTAVVNTL